MLTLAIFGVLIFLLLINVPVVVAIGLTSVVFFVGLGDARLLAMLPHRMYYGTTGFTLLAIPFFILAGNLMNTGGITDRIFRFAQSMVGHVAGGIGQVNIVASVIFSGMSGSAVADAAGLGQIEHKAMVDQGYDPADSATLVAASSVIGPVIPPSIPFVLYGSITSVSVARLFLAGFIPGIMMALGMMIALSILAKRRNYPRAEHKASFAERFSAFNGAFWPLMAPVIIVGGIMSGFFTPTEASVVVCVYAAMLGFYYKDLKLKQIPGIIYKSIAQSVSLLFIISSANFFGWLIIHQKIPDSVIETLVGFGATQSVVMWIVIGIVLTMGLFLEGNAIFLITLPLFMPIATMFDIDLVNFGVVMVLLIMIGNLTPPVGMCLFAVDSFAKVGMPALAKRVWPYLLMILLITLLIAFVPSISLFLPNLLMGEM